MEKYTCSVYFDRNELIAHVYTICRPHFCMPIDLTGKTKQRLPTEITHFSLFTSLTFSCLGFFCSSSLILYLYKDVTVSFRRMLLFVSFFFFALPQSHLLLPCKYFNYKFQIIFSHLIDT